VPLEIRSYDFMNFWMDKLLPGQFFELLERVNIGPSAAVLLKGAAWLPCQFFEARVNPIS